MSILKFLLQPREVPFRESENIAQIRDILEKGLPPVPVLSSMVAKRDQGKIEYDVQGGECTGYPIWFEEDFAIQKCFCEKGITFPEHAHKEVEVLVIITGQVMVARDGLDCVLADGDTVAFDPHEKHSLKALQDTWLLGITIPAEEGYPDGRQ